MTFFYNILYFLPVSFKYIMSICMMDLEIVPNAFTVHLLDSWCSATEHKWKAVFSIWVGYNFELGSLKTIDLPHSLHSYWYVIFLKPYGCIGKSFTLSLWWNDRTTRDQGQVWNDEQEGGKRRKLINKLKITSELFLHLQNNESLSFWLAKEHWASFSIR